VLGWDSARADDHYMHATLTSLTTKFLYGFSAQGANYNFLRFLLSRYSSVPKLRYSIELSPSSY
jgi:hypothetical protein